MKKIAAAIAAFTVLMSFSAVSHAEKIGNTIGMAYHTDIAAYINNYAIPSYAVNGTSVVVAEDLRNFGFDVVWDEASRSLNITRNQNLQPVEMTVKKGKPANGFTYILYTDIKVYAEGIQVPSYAIQGYTMIPLESLTMLGDCEWVSNEREINLWVDGLNVRDEKQPVYQHAFADKMQLSEDGNGKMYYDLDFDGNFDTIEMRQSRSYENSDGDLNTLKTELIINDKKLLIDNAYKTHGCRAVFVGDINQADKSLDIFVFMSYKSTSLHVYRYENGEIIPAKCTYIPQYGSSEVTAESFPIGDILEVPDAGNVKLYVNHSTIETPGFRVWTPGEMETITEELAPGQYVDHVSLNEKYFYFEQTAPNEYIEKQFDKY